MHNKHIWKYFLGSVTVLGVATMFVYNNGNYDSTVIKSEPKSDNLVPNVSAKSSNKSESNKLGISLTSKSFLFIPTYLISLLIDL